MRYPGGRRKRQLITALVVVAVAGLFYLEWHGAPRVTIEPEVAAELTHVAPGALYLGLSFEGLPLRTVTPFLYSDCKPGVKKRSPSPCHAIRVDRGVITGTSPSQVRRARKRLHPVGQDTH